ncbi:hypothetical protein AB6806_18630 [Bosea sp. RCC_152_1]|uniref:hypothetical protein n=1 Tax=Bosea sp. RCC_152_1 TaxID=3239228 RepID=UPI003525C454
MLKNPAHDLPPPHCCFCAADLASPRFGEARDYNGETVSVFAIACYLNEEIASGGGFPAQEIDIDIVRRSVPRNRQAFLAKPPTEAEADVDAEPLPSQPVVLIEDKTSETRFRLLDGLIRLNTHIRKGKATIRCFVISAALVDEKGRKPLAQLWPQRTCTETTPPAAPPKQPAHGETAPPVGAAIVSSDHARARHLNPNAQHPDAISILPIAITAATADQRTGRVTVALDSIIPSPIDWPRMKRADQTHLDVDLTFDRELIRRPARAAMSFPELILILYLLTLFRLIGRQSPEEKRNKAGHTIVSADPRYDTMVGAPKDLAERLKSWNRLRPGSDGPWSKPVHAGLAQLGLDWRALHGVPAPATMADHGFELIEAAFKALCLSETLRGHLHKVHSINGDHAPNHEDWRDILELMADGIVYQATRAEYQVFRADRALLALHGRFNPARIWRDTARDTLLYAWLAAIGDLNRHGRMVVTCLMAQELFIVDDIRSVPGQEHAVAPEWDLFDQALALAAGDPVRSKALRRDLIRRCIAAMRGKCAVVLTLPREPATAFDFVELSPQESIYAETLNLQS